MHVVEKGGLRKQTVDSLLPDALADQLGQRPHSAKLTDFIFLELLLFLIVLFSITNCQVSVQVGVPTPNSRYLTLVSLLD